MIFRFKQFSVSHGKGSMKVGVDSVLLGAWVEATNAAKVLDVGTGCGILALLCAQRNTTAVIDAIDIDRPSVEEASDNFANSPWGDRLTAHFVDFNELAEYADCSPQSDPDPDNDGQMHSQYDLIISNPPYFHSGLSNPATAREIARHQGGLSPEILIRKGAGLLSDAGILAMVLPYDQKIEVLDFAREAGLYPVRIAQVRPRAELPAKRIMLELSKKRTEECESIEIVMETTPGVPTPEYRTLCRDFYLYF